MDEFDLQNTALIFEPDTRPAEERELDFYLPSKAAVADFPTDPTGAQILDFTISDPFSIPLQNDQTVELYGVEYNTLVVSSDGYIDFGGAVNGSKTLEEHFDQPRVSGLAADAGFDASSGMVSFKQTSDRAVVTFEDISEEGDTDSNYFQMEMIFDGTIQLSYLNVELDDAIVGLSFGQGMDGFIETDLSGFNTGTIKAGF